MPALRWSVSHDNARKSTAFRKKLYHLLEELQTDLDAWLR